MLIAMISLFSGTTYSFFTDSSIMNEIVFMTGSNEVEIVNNISTKLADDSFMNDFKNWKPGEENAISVSWRFSNTGDHDSEYKVFIYGRWGKDSNNIVNWIQTGNDIWTKDDDKMIFYYSEPVALGEEIVLSFDVWCESISGVGDTDYLIDLGVESSQAH
jgi:hypothetical protein